jgi:3-oxoacyl-[acyl-carrier-protein] synthase-3
MSLPSLEGRNGALVRGAAVRSVAKAVPATVVPNEPIARRLGIDDHWIVERTGVRERRVAEPGLSLCELAAEAGARSLERSGLAALDVDLILVATTSQDEVTPNAAPQVAARLGASRAAAIDVGAACTAFVAALDLACGQIESGRAANALVIGADVLTRFVDPDDRRTAPLFGDGAGAVVLHAADRARVRPAVIRADGVHRSLINAPRDGKLFMQGHETYVHAVARMSEVTLEVLRRAGLSPAEIDLFVYHQANSRIIRAVGEQLELPPERVVDVVGRYGNTSAASIPIALAEAEGDTRLRDGTRVLIAAFGAGFVWGGAILEWGNAP